MRMSEFFLNYFMLLISDYQHWTEKNNKPSVLNSFTLWRATRITINANFTNDLQDNPFPPTNTAHLQSFHSHLTQSGINHSLTESVSLDLKQSASSSESEKKA